MAKAGVDLVRHYISCQSLVPEHDGRPQSQGSALCGDDLGPGFDFGNGLVWWAMEGVGSAGSIRSFFSA